MHVYVIMLFIQDIHKPELKTTDCTKLLGQYFFLITIGCHFLSARLSN
jgi:hypothetical protein